MDSNEKQRQRELAARRENERKDLEVERTIGERPLEGLSGGHTTWTGEQDDAARDAHADDEAVSRQRSEAQVERIPGGDPRK
jgi:hypothetical protein